MIADVIYNMGCFLEDLGKYNVAEKVFVKVWPSKTRLSDRRGITTKFLPKTFKSLNWTIASVNPYKISLLARLLISQARYPEAEQLLKKALDNYIREKGENDFDVGSVRLRLGSLYTQLGRVKEAEPLLMQCLHNRQEKYGENHSRVGQVMKHLLTFYEEAGNLEKAAEAGEKALKITGIVVESNPLFQNKRSDLEASKFQEFIYGLATFIS